MKRHSQADAIHLERVSPRDLIRLGVVLGHDNRKIDRKLIEARGVPVALAGLTILPGDLRDALDRSTGSYSLTITGTSSGLSKSVNVNLNVR